MNLANFEVLNILIFNRNEKAITIVNTATNKSVLKKMCTLKTGWQLRENKSCQNKEQKEFLEGKIKRNMMLNAD